MKVVLNQDVKGIGKKLQIVDVSEGYARNYLIPKKMASIADGKNVNEANTKNEAAKFKKQTEIDAAKAQKDNIEKSYIEFKHKIGEGGKLFGSVTEKEIADEVKNKFGIEVNKKKIILKDQIKQAGNYIADIKLYEGVIAKLKIIVNGM